MRAPKSHPRKAVWAVVSLAAGVLPALPARAQPPEGALPMGPPGSARPTVVEQEVPVAPYVERGLLFGPGQGYTELDLKADTAPHGPVDLSIGAGLGIMSCLTIDGSFGTLSVAPEVRYRGPQLGAWLGLVDTEPLEIDVATHVTFDVGGSPHTVHSTVTRVEPGAAAVLRLGHAMRVDAGAFLPMDMGDEQRIGLRVPVSLAVQLGPYFHAGVSSGVIVEDALDPLGAAKVPLGFSLGATAPLGSGGYALVSPSVSWPSVAEIGGMPSDAPSPPMVIGASLSIVTPP